MASSLKIISQTDGQGKPKHTSLQTVEDRMGRTTGWQDLLSCVGFHFIGAMKDVPATIVFPEHDDSGLLAKAVRQPC